MSGFQRQEREALAFSLSQAHILDFSHQVTRENERKDKDRKMYEKQKASEMKRPTRMRKKK